MRSESREHGARRCRTARRDARSPVVNDRTALPAQRGRESPLSINQPAACVDELDANIDRRSCQCAPDPAWSGFAAMIWFWLGFFALVALLLSLDLGVLHRRASEPSLRSAVGWTLGWICLGLSFAGVVYLIYEHAWLGARMANAPGAHAARGAAAVTVATGVGSDAAITYVS